MKKKHLTFEDRRVLEKRYKRGDRAEDIASDLGVHVATIYWELKRGYTGDLDKNYRPGYSADIGQRTLQEHYRARGRRKVAKQNVQ